MRANADAKSKGINQTEMKSNYFLGSDKSKWRSKIDNYSKVQFDQVYPGIDLVYYGKQRQLEYDFVIQPGADYQKIQMVFEGAESVALDDNGDLLLKTKTGDLSFQIPEIYQEEKGKRVQVEGSFVLNGKNRVGFQVASYDKKKSLVIDPTLTYSTYIGSSGSEYGTGITADDSGIYVAGMTTSSNFPTSVGAFDRNYSTSWDYVVFKLNPTNASYIYSTFLGGTSNDYYPSIAIDAEGAAYIVGQTTSTNFPTTAGAFDRSHNGSWDYSVSKLSPDGSSLIYSTYLGSTGREQYAWLTDKIAVDSSGSAYITGSTGSSNFPTTAGAFDRSRAGGFDAFVTKFSPDGSTLIYSTFLGGSSNELSQGGIVVDSEGSAYIAGVSASSNYPVTSGAYDTTLNGANDQVVSKLSPDGSSLVYSTYFGSGNHEAHRAERVNDFETLKCI